MLLRKQQHQDQAGLKALSPRQERRGRVPMMDTVSDGDNDQSARIPRLGRAGTVQDGCNEKSHVRRNLTEEPRDRKTGPLISTHRRKRLIHQDVEKSGRAKPAYSNRPILLGDKDGLDTYSFWSSKPALLIFCSLAIAIIFRNVNFVLGALIVFLYEVGVVVSKWKGFIMNHPRVTECLKLTKFWIKYSLRQAERLLSEEDRSRKAALGVFMANFGLTTSVAGGYLKQRQEEVTKRTLAEVERLRQRLQAADS